MLSLAVLTLCFGAFATPDKPGLGASFSGPWDRYIPAPASRTVRPVSVFRIQGDVRNARGILDGSGATLGVGAFITVAFEQNIGGYTNFAVKHTTGKTSVGIAHSESPFFVGRNSDGTGDRIQHDLPVFLDVERPGNYSLDKTRLRGAFKYLSFYLAEGSTTEVVLSGVSINFQAMPHWHDVRAYTGYFYSSDDLLNRIWYAGAYTLQLCTINPKAGSSIIDYNRDNGHGDFPTEAGFWSSNYTITNGSSVVTDGAKRDRMYYSGDAAVAAPSIGVSTYDLISIRNGLEELFAWKYDNEEFPYASLPMGYQREFSDTYMLHTFLGVYFYHHFTGDTDWLRDLWPSYLRSLRRSTSKVDRSGLMLVTSGFDWLRPGLEGHAIEPNAILYFVLDKSAEMAALLDQKDVVIECRKLQKKLKTSIGQLWDGKRGLFFDNVERAHDKFPQDGNVWAVRSGIVPPKQAHRIMKELEKRWTPYGAPAVEMYDTISPFISSVELKAHALAGRPQSAIDLMRRQWGHMLDGPGFTNSTLVEGFATDGSVRYPAYNVPSRNSHAHGWSTGPTHVLSEDIVGIQLLTPAGKTWRIAPRLCDLDWVQGGYATKLGKFEIQLDEHSLKVYTPSGTTGEVEIWGRTYAVEGGAPVFFVKTGGGVEVYGKGSLPDFVVQRSGGQ